MLSLVRAVVERLRNLLLVEAALDVEADLLAHSAGRRAALLRLAQRYDDEGLPAVAEELREQARAVRPDEPLARALPPAAHLLGGHIDSRTDGPLADTTSRPLLPGQGRPHPDGRTGEQPALPAAGESSPAPVDGTTDGDGEPAAADGGGDGRTPTAAGPSGARRRRR